MKNIWVLLALPLMVALSSCSSRVGAGAQVELSVSERKLLSSINDFRAAQGKEALRPSVSLTEIAREDASRRALSEEGYVDIRQKTGYERMLTLAGTAAPGEGFEGRLMQVWQKHPIQRVWLKGSYSRVGVGIATAESGLQTGVLLLGGFSAEGI